MMDKDFFNIAQSLSVLSQDPKTKIACIAVLDNEIISYGYNCFLKNYNFKDVIKDREKKNQQIIHAEIDLICRANRDNVSLKDSIVYLYGLDPCHDCLKALIHCGVKEIKTLNNYKESSNRWNKSFLISQEIINNINFKLNKF